jgi:hypothetical protein
MLVLFYAILVIPNRLTPQKVRIVFFCVRREYYSWAMLAPGCPDRHARPDAHAYCHASSSCDCAPRLLLHLARRACAWTRLPACKREREGAQHAYPSARGTEHSARVQMRETNAREREGGSTTRIPMYWPGCMCHHGGPSLVVQGRLILHLLGCGLLWRSTCAHALWSGSAQPFGHWPSVACTSDYWNWPAW